MRAEDQWLKRRVLCLSFTLYADITFFCFSNMLCSPSLTTKQALASHLTHSSLHQRRSSNESVALVLTPCHEQCHLQLAISPVHLKRLGGRIAISPVHLKRLGGRRMMFSGSPFICPFLTKLVNTTFLKRVNQFQDQLAQVVCVPGHEKVNFGVGWEVKVTWGER